MNNNTIIKIKQVTAAIAIALIATACGAGSKSQANSVNEKSALYGTSGQTQKVKEKFNKVSIKLNDFKSKKQVLCKADESLMQSVQKQLDSIDKNASMSRSQKQQAAESVFRNNDSKLQAEKARMESCIAENKNDWDSVTSEEQQYVQSCLPPPPQGGPGANSGDKRPPPPPFGAPNFDQMDASQLSSFEEALSSANCDSLF